MRGKFSTWAVALVLLASATLFGNDKEPYPAAVEAPAQQGAEAEPFAAEQKAVAIERKRLADWKKVLEQRTGDLKARAERFNKNPVDKNELAYLKETKAALNSEIIRYNKQHDELETRDQFLAEIPRQIKMRQDRILELQGQRDKLTALLKKLQDNSKWQAELDHWIKETESARLDTCLTLGSLFLGAVAGPFADAIQKNEAVAARLRAAYARSGPQVERMARLLEDLGPRTRNRELLSETHHSLEKIRERLVEARRHKEDANRVYEFIKTGLQGLSAGAREMKGFTGQGDDRALRHDILTLFTELGKSSGEWIGDTFLLNKADAAFQAGKLAQGYALRYGHFAVDFAYEGTRLWSIHSNVSSVLTSIDDLNKARAHLGKQVVDSTDRINRMNAEIRQWQQPGAQTPATMQKMLESRWVFDETF